MSAKRKDETIQFTMPDRDADIYSLGMVDGLLSRMTDSKPDVVTTVALKLYRVALARSVAMSYEPAPPAKAAVSQSPDTTGEAK